jgi:two-component system LytT family response regulator
LNIVGGLSRLLLEEAKVFMLRTMIVDDEKASRISLRKLLKDLPQIEVIGEANDGVQAVETIEETKPDLVFLDIQMPGLNGIEVLRALTLKPKPQVIFVTAYDQYAVKAFEVNAVDYLLKPVDEKRLHQAIEKITSDDNKDPLNYEKIQALLLNMGKTKSPPLLPLRRGKKIVLMNPVEIAYIRSEQGVTIVMTEKGEYWSNYNLAEVEAILDTQLFFRTHRSTIINLNKIKEIVPVASGVFDIYLNGLDRVCLPLSRDRARILRERYNF